MKKIIFILIFTLSALATHAEYQEHEAILSIRYGGTWMQDQYLSPLLYNGMKVGFGAEWWQDFKHYPNWSHVGRLDLDFSWLTSSAKSNTTYVIGIQTGWKAFYHFRWDHLGLDVMLGPGLDLDIVPKYTIREVNKPFSIDIAGDIMAHAGVSWTWRRNDNKVGIRLRYLASVNLIGMDFMPDYWQSYYEISEGVSGKLRCSGVWNHRTLHHELTMDIMAPHSTWRVGIRHQYTEYGEKNMWFSREQVELVVGTTFFYQLIKK